MSFAIATDAACDLPHAFLTANNIVWLPLAYGIGDKQFRSTLDQSDSLFLLEQMASGAKTYTVQASFEEYLELWAPIAEQGQDIVHISLSSKLSNTYHSACQAKDAFCEKYPDIKLYCIDSLGACTGQGLLVLAAQHLRDEGKSASETAQWLEDYKLKVQHWFSPSDLAYLKKGGRISSSQALFGSMLDVKPIMNINREGKLVSTQKIKGRKNALATLAQITQSQIMTPESQTIYVTHAGCPEDAQHLAEMVQSRLPMVRTEILSLGPIITVHTGPGLIAIFFWGKERES